MTILGEIPAILRLMAVFVVVLFAIRKRVSLGNAFLMGAVIMGVIFGLDLASMISSMIASVVYPKTLSLAVIVSLILVLSGSMESSGHMKRMLERFLGLLKSQRLNMVMFPALIGLLPMPGGAIFSAPMVKELGARTRLEAHHKSYVNYWFRHIWEYWWPLYPGVLLTVTMAGIDLWVFVLFLFPLTVVALLIGY
ncbi:MAG: DUF401 family protein, partial [Desulfomonilia bacterium]|nr:DUF401 family protein [Desulfomonilia bacterium]